MECYSEIEELLGGVCELHSAEKTPSEEYQLRIEATLRKVQEVIELEGDEFFKQALAKVHHTLTRLLSRCRSKTDNVQTSKKDSLEASREASINSTILASGKMTFSDVAGLHEAKRLLHEAIILPSMLPHLFSSTRRPWRRILLYGPPGTGKSKLAHAVAGEIPSTFYSVSSADLLSSWFGESEKIIKELFSVASKGQGTSVIFIDEIDSLCRKRNCKEEEQTRRIKTELLRQMESSCGKDHNVFLLCATNCPWELDTAFLRRFEKRIYVPLPERETRRELINLQLGTIQHELNHGDFEMMLDVTLGFSGSDISTCIADALIEPVRCLQENKVWSWSSDGLWVSPTTAENPNAFNSEIHSLPRDKIKPRSLTFEDLKKSFSVNHSTISPEELGRFEQFTQMYGQKA